MESSQGRVMGLDLGRRTIGVAVSDPLRLTAQGVEVWRRRTLAEDLEHLAELASRYEVSAVVVGLPLRTGGEPGPEAEWAREFAEVLARRLGVEVVLWDERFTTHEAERALIAAGLGRKKRRGVVDMTAAALILDGYLARERANRQNAGRRDASGSGEGPGPHEGERSADERAGRPDRIGGRGRP